MPDSREGTAITEPELTTKGGRTAGAVEATTLAHKPVPGASGAPKPASSSRGSLGIYLASVGLLAISGAVIAAVVMRSEHALDALEPRQALPASASASSRPPSSVSAGAPTSAPSASESASAVIKAEPPPLAPALSASELEAAKAKGSAALALLAGKHPDDPALLKALVLAYAGEKKLPLAMGQAKHLFKVDPSAVKDASVRTVMLQAANSRVDAATPAFALMTTDMGTMGPDLMYELLIAPGVGNRPKEQAKAGLAKAQKETSPALRIALDLKAAKPCERKPLLERAKSEGDARALHYLKPLTSVTGCRAGGFGGIFSSSGKDCFPCMGARTDLREAISAIEQRMSAAPAQ